MNFIIQYLKILERKIYYFVFIFFQKSDQVETISAYAKVYQGIMATLIFPYFEKTKERYLRELKINNIYIFIVNQFIF